jgi:hypothetical protein
MESVLKDPESPYPLALFTLCKTEIVRCGDPNKLMASSDVFCQLLQSGDNSRNVTSGRVRYRTVPTWLFQGHEHLRYLKNQCNIIYSTCLQKEGIATQKRTNYLTKTPFYVNF